MLSGAMFVTGAGWVLKDDKHVRTDLIYAQLSRKWRAIFDVFFFTIIFFSFAGVLTVKSVQQSILLGRHSGKNFQHVGAADLSA
jgi:TRAP-type mannitol/chloroaromatic compound transport system permease small subunit